MSKIFWTDHRKATTVSTDYSPPYTPLIMGIWDSFTGKKSSSSSNSTTASPNSPSDTFSPTPFDPSEAQDVSSFLNGPTFADPSQLHPLAGLNQQTLDYLSLEESALSDLPGSQSALPSRGWSDDLCYGTGVTYLTALTVGGAWGLQEGLRRSAGQPPKLRLNSVLNAVTRRGPFLGNSAGVIALVYNGFNSFIGYTRGKHDSANSVLAGALSGMLFKSTRGVRPMMISGGIVASVAGAWAVSLRLMINLYDTKCFQGHKKSPLLDTIL
jgi:import inner membrane translocase subunit TIM23